MKYFFTYIISRTFLTHFALAILSVGIVLWILFKLLGTYTHHGETAEVPDFKGKSISDLRAFVTGKNVGYLIIDSIYDPKEKPGIVIKQDPEAKSLVKHNRIIYLYVTSTQPPQMAMPKLVDRSTRQAVFMIESYGLKVGKITEISGDCKGCVLKQYFNGKEIEPGAAIKKGSKIDLEVGRKDDYSTPVDSLSDGVTEEEN
ncbi:MAG: penicillin-binding protein [Bacteroidota bacterium]|jgi:beta-lactam-binding protein with PASTA domain|nr:penicillin-binding protein [Bacteroidota bacterium]